MPPSSRCKKCKCDISRRTFNNSKLCRSCWLNNKPTKCKSCKKPLHKTNKNKVCRGCYVKEYSKKRNAKRVKKKESYDRCFECNQKLNKKYVKFCSNKCYGRYKKVKRRAKKSNVICHPVSRHSVYARDNFKCYICNVKVAVGASNTNWRQATLDHVIPLHEGGDHAEYNLKCCCRRCNSRKGKKPLSEFLAILNQEKLDKTTD